MRVVIDTNVVVSRYISPNGTPAQVLRQWRAGEHILLLSEAILAEYQRALSYDRVRAAHHMDAATIEQVLKDFREFGEIITPQQPLAVVNADPDDNKFLECAVDGGADYLISGDGHLLALGQYAGILILTPAAFLAVATDG